MAIIQPIHGEMRGSIGGNTYSRNRGGTYVKRFAAPVNPNTFAQQRARNILATNSVLWQSLTQAQRDAWTAWSDSNPRTNSLGQSITLTGHQMFCSLNSNLRTATMTPVAVPPTVVAPSGVAGLAGSWDPALETLTITWTSGPLPAGHKLYVFYSRAVAVTRNPNFNQARFLGASAAAATSPFTLAPGDIGEVDETKLIVFVAVIAPDGQTSAFQRLDVIASAE